MIDRPGRWFTWSELQTTSTGIDNVAPDDVRARLVALCAAVLDPLREHLGRPIRVTSAYRSPAVNRAVGGVPTSQHVAGEAADLVVEGLSPEELARAVIATATTWDQVIAERSGSAAWVHVSYRIGQNRRQTLKFKDGAYSRWIP